MGRLPYWPYLPQRVPESTQFPINYFDVYGGNLVPAFR